MKSIGFILLLVSMPGAARNSVPIPNPSFEEGGETPLGWILSGGEGEWLKANAAEGKRAIAVTGDGTDTNYWRSKSIPLRPGSVYRVRFRARRIGRGTGIAITGPIFCNRDLTSLTEEWQTHDSIFMTARSLELENSWLRFGQWHVDGTVAFDEIELDPTQSIYEREVDIALGDGESIDGNVYRFDAPFNRESRNHSRPLFDYRANFNTNRWVFGKDSAIVYRHRVGEREQTEGWVKVGLFDYRGGQLAVEASIDGKTWVSMGTIDEDISATFPLPSGFLPAREVWVRMRAEAKETLGIDSDPGAFQVNAYSYSATISGKPISLTGKTQFVGILSEDKDLSVEVLAVGDAVPGGENIVIAHITNRTYQLIDARPTVVIEPEKGGTEKFSTDVTLRPADQEIWVPYEVSATGNQRLRFTLGNEIRFEAEMPFYVSEIYNSSYGELLPGSSKQVALWRASSGWKVSRNRPVPEKEGREIVLKAARNETEAAQLIVRSAKDLVQFLPESSDLRGPKEAAIPAENVEILRVGYVDVTMPTDLTGAVAPWPDPLPPFKDPIDLEAELNHPIWIRVNVPRDVPAGDYKGFITLKAEGYRRDVPLRLTVYGFELPDRMTCTTAFGFSPGNVWQYHKLTDPAQQRQVLHKYLETYSEHHIAPYDPAPLDPFQVTWPEATEEAKPEDLVPTFNWAAWDAAMEKAIDRLHFNSFRIPIQGMGGGSFHSRHEPELLGFGEDTPEYKAAFRAYCQAVESHLREKGWLDEAFVYWFDEPEPRDYEFVMNGFRKLKEAAPDINRMLTEQVEPELVGGPNIWCPVSPRYEQEPAMERKEAGEKIWWYVCTGPKAPYCTLFIDHPATELRVWLWQTWQRKIDGILIWQATYWTSGAAYPDSLQNPYADPMGWVSSYGTEKGVRRPWGNGDGRFIYPPEAAADGTQEEAILDGPVDSIRWEMLRDGIEDYEYMAILRRLLDEKKIRLDSSDYKRYEKLLEVPSDITTDMTTFTKDPAPIERHRDMLAEAIEKLTNM